MTDSKVQPDWFAKQSPQQALASFVALAAHPIIIGTLGLLLIVFNTFDSLSDRLFYIFLLMLLGFVPAALYLLVYFKGNLFEVLELINREARLVPYILMIIGAIVAVMVLTRIDAPRPIFIMMLVLLANEIVSGTINFWTKISIHTATPTFTGLTLGYLIDPLWYGLILLVPLIAWARVYQKRHTVRQVVSGTIFAALITITVLILSHNLV